jgi:hypothetical protein
MAPKQTLSNLMLRATYLGERYVGSKPSIEFYDPRDEAEDGEFDVRLWGARFVVIDENGAMQRGRGPKGIAYAGEADTPEDALQDLIEDVEFCDVLAQAFRPGPKHCD